MTTLKQAIIQLNEEKGWGVDKEDLFDTFSESEYYDVVYQGPPDHHRWYTNYEAVWKVPINGVDRYFQYYIMSVDGDNTAEECGYRIPDLDDLVEVFPKIVPTTIYVTQDKL
jgi:hypothetical protein